MQRQDAGLEACAPTSL